VELPFIGDQVVCLSHDQAARSGAEEGGALAAVRSAGPDRPGWVEASIHRKAPGRSEARLNSSARGVNSLKVI
jgi:hypothetical protein